MTIVAFNICRPGKHNNRLKYRSDATTRAKMKRLLVFGRNLEYRGKAVTSEGWHGDR